MLLAFGWRGAGSITWLSLGGLVPDAELNAEVEKLLIEQRNRATKLLDDNSILFTRLVSALLNGKVFTPVEFEQMFPELNLTGIKDHYISSWNAFKKTNMPEKAPLPENSWLETLRFAE